MLTATIPAEDDGAGDAGTGSYGVVMGSRLGMPWRGFWANEGLGGSSFQSVLLLRRAATGQAGGGSRAVVICGGGRLDVWPGVVAGRWREVVFVSRGRPGGRAVRR